MPSSRYETWDRYGRNLAALGGAAMQLARNRRASYAPSGDLEQKEIAYDRKRWLAKKRGSRRRKRGYQATRLKRNGVQTKTIRRKKRRRGGGRKKSTRKLLRQLKSSLPKFSTMTFRDFEFLTLSTSEDLQHRIYEIDYFTKTMVETWINQLRAVDTDAATVLYTNVNSKVKLNMYGKLTLKNNSVAPCVLKYQWVDCKDSTSKSYLDRLKEEWEDRGYTAGRIPIVNPSNAKTATSSKIPRRINLDAKDSISGANDGDFYHLPVFSGAAPHNNWKPCGPAQTITIGAGDEISIKTKKKNWTYDKEQYDQESGVTYHNNTNRHLIISVKGVLGHDETNGGLIGRGQFRLDCEWQQNAVVKYANPLGLRDVVMTQVMPDEVNFLNSVHVDEGNPTVEG